MSKQISNYFKVLNEDGSCYHGGNGNWHLPNPTNNSGWMPEIKGNLTPCKNGYHLCRVQDLLSWIGPAVFEAEYQGDVIEERNTIVVRKSRLTKRLNWNSKVARLLGCDIVEHVLPLYKAANPHDKSIETLIEVARKYANNQATQVQLEEAVKALTFKGDDWWEDATSDGVSNDIALAASDFASKEDFYLRIEIISTFALYAAGRNAIVNISRNTDENTKADIWKKASQLEYQWQISQLLSYLYK